MAQRNITWLVIAGATAVLWQSLAAEPGGVPAPTELLAKVHATPGTEAAGTPSAKSQLPGVAKDTAPVPDLVGTVPDSSDKRALAVTFADFANAIESDGKNSKPAFAWVIQAAGGELLDDLALPGGQTFGAKYPDALAKLSASFRAQVGDPAKDSLDAEKRAKAVSFWRSAAASFQ